MKEKFFLHLKLPKIDSALKKRHVDVTFSRQSFPKFPKIFVDKFYLISE